MLKKDIKVGGKYRARVNGKLTTVRVDYIKDQTRWNGRACTTYEVYNLTTGRTTTFRSAQKFINEVGKEPPRPSKKLKEAAEAAVASILAAPQEEDSCPFAEPNATTDATATTTSSDSPKVDAPTEVEQGIHPAAMGALAAVNPALVNSLRAVEDEQCSDPTSSGSDADCPKSTSSKEDSSDPFGIPERRKPGNGCEDSSSGPTRNTIPLADGRASVLRSEKELATVRSASSSVNAGLAGDQPVAFNLITQRLAQSKQITKLCGYAGTGKTYLLARIAEWAKAKGREVVIAAPTHKAAGVIQEKLGADIEVRTIHSLLGLKLEPDWENDSGEMVLKDGVSKNRINKGLVICDEASMVGEVLKERIDNTHGVIWLFVGDLAQLPPVGEGVSKLLNDPDASLNVVLRQAKGSEILNLATRIRGGDLSMEYDTGKDVFRVHDAEELFYAALERFQSAEYQKDAAHARMLVFRNERRKAINQRMRKLLVDSPEPYALGEWLVMYSAFAPEKSRLNVLAERAKAQGGGSAWRPFFRYKESLGDTLTQLHVSEEVRVIDVEDGTIDLGDWSFNVHRIHVLARGDEHFELPVLKAEEVEGYEKIKTELMQAALALRTKQKECEEKSHEWYALDADRRQAWQMYFTLEETFAQVDYAYAMTVHKSQGSTFDHVFVDVPDLLSSGGMQQRILYTACTRPAKSLTFYK